MGLMRINDAEKSLIVETDKESGKVGVEYNIGDYNAIFIKDTYDEADFHYFERKTKQPIPKGTRLKVECWWMNFYGSYFKVRYNGKSYDVKTTNVVLKRKE